MSEIPTKLRTDLLAFLKQAETQFRRDDKMGHMVVRAKKLWKRLRKNTEAINDPFATVQYEED